MNDRYEVTGFLGKGGFAAVYAGFDKVIEREVAIKVLSVHAGTMEQEAYAEKLERFRREAKASARIAHPNVVTVFDMGVIADTMQPYIVMEVLHGHSLSEELRDHGPLAPARAVGLFVGALDALGEAHALGIVHKDLKPSNLFLVAPHTALEELKVVDFGIARFDEEDAGLTGTGQVFGTARYFAPEYISEQLVTPALDVYQMGLILVELLCGLPAVRSNNPLECVMCHGRGQLEIPESLLQGVLGPVLLRAVSMDLAARYTDANRFRDALLQIDADAIAPVSPGELTRRLDEVSANMRSAVSGLNVAVTGQGRVPDSRDDLAARSGPQSGDVIVNLGGVEEDLLLDEPDTSPEALHIAALTGPTPAPRRSRALPAVAVLAAALFVLVLSVSVGAVIGLFLIDTPADEAVHSVAGTGDPSGRPADNLPDPGLAADTPDEVDALIDEVEHDSNDEPHGTVGAAPSANGAGSPPGPQGDAEAAPAQIAVELRSTPSQATVWVDGAKVGTTPWRVALAGQKTKQVQLRKAGYRTARVSVGPKDAPTVTVPLRKSPTRPARQTPVTKQPTRIPIAK